MKLIFKGGSIVSGTALQNADVQVEGEKITAIGSHLPADDAQVIDVRDKLLFPGFIDAHTHFDLAVAGTVTADDFASGTRAALLGGTTTVIDFATQYRGESLKEAYLNWQRKAQGKACCDYGFHMSVSDWNPAVSEELEKMMSLGITSFKLYMTYDAMKVDDKQIFQILTRLKEIGGIAGVHCENSGIIDALVEEKKKLGLMCIDNYPQTRPAAVEAEAVNRLLRIAEIVETPVIIVHLSSCEGFRAVGQARARGQVVYVETCPQYLLLDDSQYEQSQSEGLKFVIAPPLRKKDDQACLWEALNKDQIQTIATDHCSFTTRQKELGKDDFTKIPGGMPGVETRAALIYSYGVSKNRITVQQMCRLLAENPAKLYGLFPRKGSLSAGSDADIVVFNPNAHGIFQAKNQASRSDYSPFENMPASGQVDQVYLRGQLVVSQNQCLTDYPGCYIPRMPLRQNIF